MDQKKQAKKNIYVFATAYDPFIGGAEIAIRETVTRLSDSFTFFIFTARMSPDLPHIEEKQGATIIRIGFGSKIDKLLLIPLIPIEALRWFSKHPPALLWSVMISYAFPAAMILKWWRGVPLLLTLQEGNREWEFQRNNLGASWLGWRIALKNTGSLAAISSFLLNLSRSIGYRGEGAVIPNGVTIERFASPAKSREAVRKELDIPEDAFLLVTASRLVHKNGVDIVLEALTRLPESYRRRTHFLIVGGGELEGKLKDLTKSLGLRGTVHFIGERGNDELPDLLAAADAFVRPSRSEGLGISFIEALAAGLPAIGSNVGGIPDVIKDGETGLLVQPENPDDLSEKIVWLQKNPGLAKAIAERGALYAREHFSWEGVTAAYHKLFSRLVERKPRILIATGIYPPDLGGIAKIATLFKENLERLGYGVSVIAYGERPSDEIIRTTRALPTGLRHLLAFIRALPLVRKCDVIILLDHFSIGLPVAAAARVLRKPYMIRIGGDFLWESHVESKRKEVTLTQFNRDRNWGMKETAIFRLSRWVMGGAKHVVFTTSWQEQVFKEQYGITNASVIENASPLKSEHNEVKRTHEIIYAGRFLYLKNLARLLRVFQGWKRETKNTFRLRLIGEGPEKKRLHALIQSYGMNAHASLEKPMEKRELMRVVQSARAVIVPSFSDVSPNLVLEALSFGVPAVLTTYSGYQLDQNAGVLRIDPMDEAAIKSALDILSSPKRYKALSLAASHFSPPYQEKEMLESYQKIIASLLS